MRLLEIKDRHRNDYRWLGECESCGHTHWWGDGYADCFYLERVIPARHCPRCGMNSLGEKREVEAS